MPQKISLVVRPRESTEIPWSEGYQLYSAILNVMRGCDEKASRRAHDSPLSSISLSHLDGKFGRSQRPRHKCLDPANRYNFRIGITDPKEAEIFRAIVQPLILREQDILLEKGALMVEEAASSSRSFEELLMDAGKETCTFLEFEFISPTCIQYRNTKVMEMFPHREAVFSSLLAKWNAVCPEGQRMALERDDMARYLMEEPLSYETHSAMVNTVMDNVKGHPRPILRPGFKGRCRYIFAKNAPEGMRNGILALARFAEYSGVGSAVARGCGAVKVMVGEVEK
ncbi:MAG: CRISPR system precrRNA processing endoribonuclease RAMP protein Cas6 [Methanotrichaceae archaeon]|nr:CRISPR system precrRNA processing endoribonuclease RAMP protein Cas6 [Methanotrichaceae archaeon]